MSRELKAKLLCDVLLPSSLPFNVVCYLLPSRLLEEKSHSARLKKFVDDVENRISSQQLNTR